MSSYYTVQQTSANVLSIIDLRKNSIINRVTFPGTLTNGPVVVGDRCTIMTKRGSSLLGLIFKIPSGSIVDLFTSNV